MSAQFGLWAAGIIFDETKKKVLLCHRTDHDLWNLPGGALESDETPMDGVIREVKEETGLIVTIIKLTGIYVAKEKGFLGFCFLCKIVGGKLTLNEESSAIEYFDIEKLPENIFKNHVDRIKDALSDAPLEIKRSTESFEEAVARVERNQS